MNQKAQSFKAKDGTSIAYFVQVPDKVDRVMVFIHCGGGYINDAYLSMAQSLLPYHVKSYLMDLRGHGLSGGPRGHVSTRKKLYTDLHQLISLAKQENPGKQIILMGHSIACGLILNYITFYKYDTTLVDALYFIAPNFGILSKTYKKFKKKKKTKKPFIRNVSHIKIAIHHYTKGLLFSKSRAFEYALDEEQLKKKPLLVKEYSCEMFDALTPPKPKKQIKKLKIPFKVLLGEKDVLIDRQKLEQFLAINSQPLKMMVFDEEDHFSVVKKVSELFN